MKELFTVAVTGPLAGHVERFCAALVGVGYTPGTARAHGYVLVHLSRWLLAERLEPAELTPAVVGRFVCASAAPYRGDRDAASRGVVVRGRRGAPAPKRVHDSDLRQGRPGLSRPARTSVAGDPAMNALARSVQDYLAMRRSVGYALRQEGRMLADFVDYLEHRGTTQITIEAAVAWATTPAQANLTWWAKRLAVVRGFAAHLKTLEEDTEVPPKGLLPNRAGRTTPYLFSPEQIIALMAAASRLACPLRAATFEALIGLMALTGLRTGEAIALNRADVDLAEGVLTIWHSKLGKSRQIPLHDTTTTALGTHAQRRDELWPHAATSSFFLSGGGTRLNHTNTSTTFAVLLTDAGIAAPPGRRRPRLYDLRHSFAVATLIARHADGAEVQSRLPVLSTWMGHIKPATTYWYLQAAPELLTVTALRLERHLGEQP